MQFHYPVLTECYCYTNLCLGSKCKYHRWLVKHKRGYSGN